MCKRVYFKKNVYCKLIDVIIIISDSVECFQPHCVSLTKANHNFARDCGN